MSSIKESDYATFRDTVRGWDQTRSLSEFVKVYDNTFGNIHMLHLFQDSIRNGDRDISSFFLENFPDQIQIFEEDYRTQDGLKLVEEFIGSTAILPIVEARITVKDEQHLSNILSMLKNVRVDKLAIKSISKDMDTLSVLSDLLEALEPSTETITDIEISFLDKDSTGNEKEIDKIKDFIGKCRGLKNLYIGITHYTYSPALSSDEASSMIDIVSGMENIQSVNIGCKGYDPFILEALQSFAYPIEIDWVSSRKDGRVLLEVLDAKEARTLIRIRRIGNKIQHTRLTIYRGEGGVLEFRHLFSI